jgi:hypothetical protein
MSHELHSGDRVRVTERCRMHLYRAGDRGVVAGRVFSAEVDAIYYAVRVDKNSPEATAVLFAEDEIEPDD